jgi:peptide/nickel transport system substrate-binding protein
MEYVKDLWAKDDKTFTMALKEPFGLVIPAFASTATPDLFIMPKLDFGHFFLSQLRVS